MVYPVALVNMPFAAADLPSIALTQLKAVLRREQGDRVSCSVFYPNLDFVGYLGLDLYEIIANTVQANTSGLGDWFFSQAAFPEMPDDPQTYLTRHFSEHRAQLEILRGDLAQKRSTVGAFLDELIDRYELDRCRLVGFTSMFSQNVASFAMAKRLKERNPQIVVVMGGANCETPMCNVLARNVPWVDFVFSGPALGNFPKLVGYLMDGEEDRCHTLGGIISREKLERLGGNAAEIGEELDINVEVPLDYSDYFAALEQKLPGVDLAVEIPFETSRGCWWGERAHCTFCGLNGMTMKYRVMEPARALLLLHDLFNRYGTKARRFQSVDNILPREYLTEVLPYLETPEPLTLFYEVKADLKEHEMAVLANARVMNIQPGIEALSSITLKLMRKGTTSFQNIKFLKHCDLYKIKAFWNLLVGFPGEPEEVYKKYCAELALLVHLQPPSGAHPVRFDRFSPYHAQAKEYNLKLKPSSFYELIYPFPRADLEDFAYFFVDEDYNAPYLIQTARWLGKLRDRINYWQTRWHQRDGLLRPELVFKSSGGARLVYDSRAGRPVEHRLSQTALKVLDALDKQQRISHLADELDLPAGEVERQVASLKQRGLLFEEDGLYLSLVVRPPREEATAVMLQQAQVEDFNFAES